MARLVRRRKLMGEINVVPYIDVMLVLLQHAGASKVGFLTDPVRPPARGQANGAGGGAG